jgi:hypothetical protein
MDGHGDIQRGVIVVAILRANQQAVPGKRLIGTQREAEPATAGMPQPVLVH